MGPWKVVCRAILIFSSIASVAQTQAPIQRDTSAVNILLKSVAAMGAPTQLPSGYALQLSGGTQVNGSTDVRTFVNAYKVSNGSLSFKRTTSSAAGASAFASGGGSPQSSRNGHVQTFNNRVLLTALPFDVPSLVLALELQNANYSIVGIPPSSVTAPLHVRTRDESDDFTRAVTVQDWYFDPSTYLPIRVEFKLQDVADGTVADSGTCDYLSYANMSGLINPTELRTYETGIPSTTIRLSGIQINPALAASFDTLGSN